MSKINDTSNLGHSTLEDHGKLADSELDAMSGRLGLLRARRYWTSRLRKLRGRGAGRVERARENKRRRLVTANSTSSVVASPDAWPRTRKHALA
jgi:hypothetical protein